MPATEQTRYNLPRLHRIFAVSSVLLTIVTVWMLARDHHRQWKTIQRTNDRIDMQLTAWRKLQTLTEDVASEHERLEQALAESLSQPLSEPLISAFCQAVQADARRRQATAASCQPLEQALAELNAVAAAAEAARQAWQAARLNADKARLDAEDAWARAHRNDGDEVESLRQAARELEATSQRAKADLELAGEAKRAAQAVVVPMRERVLAALDTLVHEARFREDELLRARKMELAELDVDKARLGFGVRDGRGDAALKQLQDEIEVRQNRIRELTLDADAAIEHRRQLQAMRSQVTEQDEAIRTRLDENAAESKRLNGLLTEKRSSYFHFWGIIPLPGKKWLELPILDAFNSPRKIDNIWNEGLDRAAGSFGRVPRFDRCSTCHQSVQKALPEAAAQPVLCESTLLDFSLQLPSPPNGAGDAAAQPPSTNQGKLQAYFGLRLAADGLLHEHHVTVQSVDPKGLAQRARRSQDVGNRMRAGDILQQMLFAPQAGADEGHARLGLLVGDVIVAIDDESVPSDASAHGWVTDRLVEAAAAHWMALQQGHDPKPPLRLRVQRGLPHPYAGHPRLDLFVGATSPHRMAEFGCTVCHEGQGSATDFQWTSHSPNDLATRQQWRADYGWFDNRNWEFPMYPRRFVESSCLKCHHDVVELEESERYEEPPAPKVARGFRLIHSLGCYGCHEISGFDDQGRRVGPDLRLEPNYVAAALQFQGAAGTGYDKLTDMERAAVDRLIQHPEDDLVRRQVYELLVDDARIASRQIDRSVLAAAEEGDATADEAADDPPRFSDYVHQSLLPLLKAHERPGSLRKVGPSLRFVRSKLDDAFLADWIRRPDHFRPATRMPRSFGLWRHLPAEQLRARKELLLTQLQRTGDDAPSRPRHARQQLESDLAAVESELARLDDMEKRFESMAIYSMVRYLQDFSQAYRYVDAPAGITPVATEEEKQAQISRGKITFEERGCLACHDHVDFPDVAKYRDPGYVVRGPDLSDLAAKFSPQRHPDAMAWLSSWISQPTRYSPRTTMPDLLLTPVTQRDAGGNVTAVTDSVADIVAYLMSRPAGEWQPSGEMFLQWGDAEQETLEELTLTYLKDLFPQATALRFLQEGIPFEQRGELRGAERELLVSPAQQGQVTAEQLVRKRLYYVAQKSFANSGCFACHDIPGLEDAKPIGPVLADWGRKNTTQLAFGHVARYVRHGEGGGATPAGDASTANNAPAPAAGAPPDLAATAYYQEQLEGQTRIGFIYQKLREPRSFDYTEARNKKYTERLRMPQFSLTLEQREAIITFVLGLVADPPTPQYLYSPDARARALLQGQEVMTRYSCRGCHLVRAEKWDLAFTPDVYGQQTTQPTYPFVPVPLAKADLVRSRVIDPRGLRHARIEGMPAISHEGRPVIFDEEEFPIEEEEDEEFDLDRLIYSLNLQRPAAVDGYPYQVGEVSFDVAAEHLQRRQPSYGGALAKYLLPRVVLREREVNPNAKGSEAWAWLPPALVGEGEKVQPEWLFAYLLRPHLIRPAAVMRMPRYNMSEAEARMLVDYFAALDRAEYPYNFESIRQPDHLAAADQRYAARLQKLADEGELPLDGSTRQRHLSDAMRIVTNGNYCVKCHLIGDFDPAGIDRIKAPDLALVHRRLRTPYLRKWLAKPTAIQPYTSMPVNIPYDPTAPLLGTTLPQGLYHGSSLDQLDALVDLLMNFDQFSRDRSPITPMVELNANAPTDPDAAPPPSN